MKTKTKLLGLLTLAVALAQLTSCNRESDASYYSESTYSDFKEEEYTKWMPKDDLQMFVENLDTSNNWVYRIEGRDFKGLSQYRYALRKKPSDATGYQVRSGRKDTEYYSLGISYQRDGYKRVSLQLFKDSSGIMRYNSVWFKYGEKKESTQPKVLPPTDAPPSKLEDNTSERN